VVARLPLQQQLQLQQQKLQLRLKLKLTLKLLPRNDSVDGQPAKQLETQNFVPGIGPGIHRGASEPSLLSFKFYVAINISELNHSKQRKVGVYIFHTVMQGII
jgi:hypothetical protein